jgi:hypothetical protein
MYIQASTIFLAEFHTVNSYMLGGGDAFLENIVATALIHREFIGGC